MCIYLPELNGDREDYFYYEPPNSLPSEPTLTYNQNIGGWNKTGLITPVEKIEPLTLEYVRGTFLFK